MEVSSPSHPRYGKHLKRDELKDLIKPRAESTSNILSWLEQSGIEARDIENDGEWINFYAPIKRAEQMMGTTFKTYQSEARTSIKKIRSLDYSVPKHVRGDIDIIQPTTRFGHIQPERSHVLSQEEVPFSALAVDATCNKKIIPDCIANLYNFGDYNASDVNVTIGVSGFLKQYARFTDWEKFASIFSPKAVGSTFQVTSINGAVVDQNSTEDSGEANLDIQYTLGLVAPKIATRFFYTPGYGPEIPVQGEDNEPYLDFFSYLLGLDDDELPDVLTTSYGENEQNVPAEFAKKACDMIGQLGARGVSVLFSSGDSGPGYPCKSIDGNTTRFNPVFPASCPYVTAVGATTGVEPEKGVYFSSGGFSELWPRPAYQDKAVAGYLEKLGDRWKGLYNAEGRGFPDVAAQGQAFQVIDKGKLQSESGTSASAPVFASVVALLNNARKAAGMPSLGFLNPWIYEQGYKGLNDIVAGGSTGCGVQSNYSTPVVPFASWNATEGWDAVTGHGTPDFKQLLSLTMMPKSGERRVRRGGLNGRP
jgi:tripeptidyl-peptidase-1